MRIPASKFQAILLSGVFVLVGSTWAMDEDANETEAKLIYSPQPQTEISLIPSAPERPRSSCDLRTRELDKAACRSVGQTRKIKTAMPVTPMLKPRIPDTNWRSENSRLTSNLRWY